ncbi:MAG: NAD(P)H-hydrate epimerase [Planctomycetes bacterium]|nr:NAD(P)H-hydrate epimerase [Planctomycetota bacterium]
MPPRPRSREEMRELDRRAIQEFGVSGLILMENAGRAVADEADRLLTARGWRRAVALIGKGNNGGDGFVAARHLFNRGREVEIVLVGDHPPPDPNGDAGRNALIAQAMKLPVRRFPAEVSAAALGDLLAGPVVTLDALFGTGLSGAPASPYRETIAIINAHAGCVLAVDIPSGLDANTGQPLGAAARAEVTVTFGASKLGFFAGDGPRHAGRVVVAEISIPRMLLDPPRAGEAG